MEIGSWNVGSDPEGFLFDLEEGKFVTAIGLIGGDKTEPLDVGDGYHILEDNVMVEFNIPPSIKGERLEYHNKRVTSLIEKRLGGRYEMRYEPTVVFTKEDLDHPKAQEFGCEPDYDVYTSHTRNIQLSESTIRDAGGHIHISYEGPELSVSAQLVKYLDLYAGIPSVLLDSSNGRRKRYGQPGAFRFKSYGFEYRTLSNFWVTKYEDLINHAIAKSFEAFNNKLDISGSESVIQHAIIESDKELATQIINDYDILD